MQNKHSRQPVEFGLSAYSPLGQFMVISILGMTLTLLALVYTHFELSDEYLQEHLNSHNRNLSVVLRNSLLATGLEDALRENQGRLSDEMLAEITATLDTELRWVPIVKIKVYGRNPPEVLYSTNTHEIGKNASDNEGVQSALAGVPLSGQVHPNHLNEFDNIIEVDNVHQQYIPIRSRDSDEVIGVFETYLNVHEVMRNIKARQRKDFWLIGLILLLFFGGLAYTFLRTHRLLQIESQQRRMHLDELKRVHAELEERVEARTAELDQAKNFLQSVIDGIGNPLLVIRPDFTIALMNRQAKNLLPADQDEANFKYCYQISHRLDAPCTAPDHPCSFAQVMQKGCQASVTHTHYDADNNPMTVELLTTPLYSADGEFVGVIEVEHDITQMVRMQAGLVESEARLQATMDNVPDAIFTCTEDYVIESANRSACHMFDCAAADLVGRKVSDLGAESVGLDAPSFENTTYQQAVMQRFDGEAFPVDLWIGPLEQDKQNSRYIVVVRDITSRIQSQRELDTSRQQYFHQDKMVAIGQLAAGILHEVGNPIAAIAGATAEVRQVYVPQDVDDDVRKNIDLIGEQIARLGNITREIADFASPRPRERELLDLNGLIRSTAQLLAYDRRFSSIGIDLRLDRNLPAIFGVADQLTQVFMNLLINSMDACAGSDRGGDCIIVSTEPGDAEVRVLIEDFGSGMSQETLGHVMEMFYTTKPVGKGSGLGLSLCDTIVRAHGGSLKIESEEGRGTRVYVILPIDRDGTNEGEGDTPAPG